MKAWAKSFYLSAAWEKTRAAYLMSQDHICERCGQPAKIVHHKRWLNRENINDLSVTLCWDNLEALCQDCHNKEHHKQERHKRYRFDENGGILHIFSCSSFSAVCISLLTPFLHIAYGNIHTGAVIINTAFAVHIVTNTATSTAACPISSTASTMPSIYSNIYYPVFLLNLNISAASLLYDCLYVQVCRQHNHAACS